MTLYCVLLAALVVQVAINCVLVAQVPVLLVVPCFCFDWWF